MATHYFTTKGNELIIDGTERTALFLRAIVMQLDSLSSELFKLYAPKAIRRVVDDLKKEARKASSEVGPYRMPQADDVAAIYSMGGDHIVLIDEQRPEKGEGITGSAGPVVFALEVLRQSLTGEHTLKVLNTIQVTANEAEMRGDDVNVAIEKALASFAEALESAA